MIAAGLDDLCAVDHLILAAGGAHKVPVFRAGIKAGLAHALITDEAAAQKLLE